MAESLDDKLIGAMIEWPEYNNQFFIPVNDLNSILIADNVKGELRAIYHPSDLKNFSDTHRQYTRTRKRFLLLSVMERLDLSATL